MKAARDDLAEMAHVLRRTTFGPFPGNLAAAAEVHHDAAELLEAQLAAPPLPFDLDADLDDPADEATMALDNQALLWFWIDRMRSDEAGLHEKIMWFWHGHFTTSFEKATAAHCFRQLRTIHRLALGNLRDLTLAMVTDAAMLQYLDGDASERDHPNENLGRELMELFTLGTGHYTEDDVRAAAVALAGWQVPGDAVRAEFTPGPVPEVTFLGRTGRFDAEAVVDILMGHDATAPFVTRKLATYLLGPTVDDAAISRWAAGFRSGGYEIRPLVEEILRSPEFATSYRQRPRHGMEWLCLLMRTAHLERVADVEVEMFGQIPYKPPSVVGWPDIWLTSASLFARASFLQSVAIDRAPVRRPGNDLVAAILDHCGIVDASEGTVRALRRVDKSTDGDQVAILRAALVSPEASVS